jgi:MFS family permease
MRPIRSGIRRLRPGSETVESGESGVALGQPAPEGVPLGQDPYRGKWSTLSNTTLGVLMASIDASIVLISLPDIFRGIHLNPLAPSNTGYFLWLLMGYMLVTAVLVVSFGRLGDIFGRVRMYNLGFVIFTVFSVMLSITWLHGAAGALYMIVMRIFQGVGGAFLMANSTAIITDAFPEDQRGLALGTNAVAGIAGSFIGLVLGGVLGPIDWRLVFLISVPVGVVGTVWAYINLEDKGIRTPARIDWIGNTTFAVGLVALLVGIVYGLEPYRTHAMGWTNPFVLAALIGGAAVLVLFVWVETKVEAPMFRIPLFRIRAFAAGQLASLLASLGRGGLMFTLVIWLQGIWLPEHGYSFARTPLWAGIYMLPLTFGFLAAGPASGFLSDRFGARPFATGGMLLAAASFGLLELLPINFSYVWFAPLLFMNGVAMGMFASPNRAGIMNALPPAERGQGAGMVSTSQNAAMVLSIGIFFTLLIVGLAAHLPSALYQGLVAQGVPKSAAAKVAHLPPTSTVFGAFLGYNPIKTLLGPTLATLPASRVAVLTGHSFFPNLITKPFTDGLHTAFDFSLVAMLVAAGASWLRGPKAAVEPVPAQAPPTRPTEVAPAALQGLGPAPVVVGDGVAAIRRDRSGPARVVTISGSFGAGAGWLGPALAQRLGLPFLDRAIPLRVSEDLGVPLDAVVADDERRQGALARSLLGLVGDPGYFGVGGLESPLAVSEDAVRKATEKLLWEVASGPGGVVVGRAGAVVLGTYPQALHLRLDAPPDVRVERVVREEGLSEAEAWHRLRRVDGLRSAYLRDLYGRDPADPTLYHLVFDTAALPLDACLEVAAAAAVNP